MLKRVFSTAVALLFGLIVLLGIFLPDTFFQVLRVLFLDWVVVVAAFALVLALFHLLRVHLVRLGRRGKGWDVSLLIIASMLLTAGVVLWEQFNDAPNEWSQRLVESILIPGESTLLALTSVTLILAGMRMLRVRRSLEAILFVFVVVLTLLISVPYVGFPVGIVNLGRRVLVIFTTAGMRGLIIGVALGITLTGLRAIFVTRPYTED
ncbi:MAG: hypothetical protein ACLFU8_04615 [Anaerolineales bacterium]